MKKITILGDLNLDWSPKRPLPLTFSNLTTNVQIWLPIEELPGGTAFNVALFSKLEDMSPFVIGNVGNDLSGQIIIKELKTNKIKFSINVDNSLKTGKTFISWDTNLKENIRLLVVDYPNANINLYSYQIEKNRQTIQTSDYLFVSGYCLMNPDAPRFQSTIRAMQLAKQSKKCKVVLDVVPHKIYEKISFKKYYKLIKDVDIIVSEVATIRRFLNIGHKTEKITERLAKETSFLFTKYFPNFILRYGVTGSSKQIIFKDKLTIEVLEDEKMGSIPKRGFSDHQTIKLLSSIF